MTSILFHSILGYLSGSVLYGPLWAKVLKKGSITENSKDNNPGVSNAFVFGGFWCGVLTLIFELLKGIIPIWLYIHRYSGGSPFEDFGFAFVLAAPVLGHNFSVFHKFKGGKGIAVTFGCLLGMLPLAVPLLIMAASFVFFSIIIKISPHFYRTIVSYVVALAAMGKYALEVAMPGMGLGFAIITAAVALKLHCSNEEREKVRINLLWMH